MGLHGSTWVYLGLPGSTLVYLNIEHSSLQVGWIGLDWMDGSPGGPRYRAPTVLIISTKNTITKGGKQEKN